MGAEIDHLKTDIEKKENAIVEKDKALDVLRQQNRELDERLKEAQQDISQNQTLIAYLTETKDGLTKQLKDGQDELQKLQEDKQTYKNTVDFIVSLRTQLRKKFVNKCITLQKQITSERTKVSALQQNLEQDAIEYENRIENAMQEKRTLEQKNSQLEHAIMDNQVAIENQRTYYEAKIRDLQERHDAKVYDMTDQIEGFNEQIEFLEKEKRTLEQRKAQLEHSVMNNQSKLDTLQEEHNVLVSKVAEETVLYDQKTPKWKIQWTVYENILIERK